MRKHMRGNMHSNFFFSHQQTSSSSVAGPGCRRQKSLEKMFSSSHSSKVQIALTDANSKLNASTGASTCLSLQGPSGKPVTCPTPRCDQTHCAEITQSTWQVLDHLALTTTNKHLLWKLPITIKEKPSFTTLRLYDMQEQKYLPFHDANKTFPWQCQTWPSGGLKVAVLEIATRGTL